MDIVFEVIGWAGTALILFAYLMLSIGKLENGRTYQLINLFGAIGLLINGAVHAAWPSAILNVVWSGIAVYSLIQLVRKRGARPVTPPAHTP